MRERIRPGWSSRAAAQVAIAWSIYVAIMGVYWSAGGAGYPFGHSDPSAPDNGSLLGSVDAPAGAPWIVVVGVVGLVLVWLLEHHRPATRTQRVAVIAAAVGYACLLVSVTVDGRALMLLPPLGLGLLKWLEVDWPSVFQVTVVVAGACFVLAAVGMARRTADRSPAGITRARERSHRWDRIGRIATYVAMLCPMPYAIIRLCWSRGWPVGAPEPFVEHILRTQPENVWIEPILASFALTGSALTFGLVCRWGRIFPHWLPILRGRSVPLWLPLGLGGSAVIGIWSFGRGMLLGHLGVKLPSRLSEFQQWGMSVSGWEYWGADGLGWILFPLWSISLAFALVGYYHRWRLLAELASLPRLCVTWYSQSSRYPACNMFRISRRNRLSWIFSANVSIMTWWSNDPKQSEISISINQVVPFHVSAISRKAVWQPRRGRKPCDRSENRGS